MKIRNKYLRGLTGMFLGFLFVALFFVLAAVTSAALMICKIVPADADFGGLVMIILLIVFSSSEGLIFVEWLKPDKKATPEENKPAKPNPEHYHPECWDEKDLNK